MRRRIFGLTRRRTDVLIESSIDDGCAVQEANFGCLQDRRRACARPAARPPLPANLTGKGMAIVAALRYPPTTKGDVVVGYHGRQVADPYRWLEDLGSADTRAWIDAQNGVTLPFLEKLPCRAALLERLTQLWNYPRTGLPLREAGQLFYRRNTGLQ